MKDVASMLDGPPVRRWIIALSAIIILLFIIPTPVFPQDTLDGAWVLAAEQASRTGEMFGRDFVFTYGPLAVLATGLFSSTSFIWVLLAGLAIGLCWLGPLFASARPYVVCLYLLAIPVAILGYDARMVSALLAVCLLGMAQTSWWSIAAACGWGIIALSKLSFALVALPLMLLLDVYRIAKGRRIPLHTAGFVSTFLIGLAASGVPPTHWLEAARNDGSMISAYSGALQVIMHFGGAMAMLTILVMLATVTAFSIWLIRSRETAWYRPTIDVIFPTLAIAWCLWMSFKMGFVRADAHMVITWTTLAMTIPVVVATAEIRRPLTTPQRIAAPILMIVIMAGTFGFVVKTGASETTGPAGVLKGYIVDLARRPIVALSWLTPQGWRRASADRSAAEAKIRRTFAFPAGTTADIIPYRLSPVIISNLRYEPRPVPQSYSAYTALLQQLDARHFASSAAAPQLLFMDANSDIDERLPTLAAGPSLPIIAQWYDVVGTDQLGAVLRRRAGPRPSRQAESRSHTVRLGEWIDLPAASATTMIAARIQVERKLLAKATGILAHEPLLFIELRGANGIARYRFVPGMAEADVVVSPMVRNPSPKVTIPDRAIGLVSPGSRPAATMPVTAIRLVGDSLGEHSYGDVTLKFRTWDFVVPSVAQPQR